MEVTVTRYRRNDLVRVKGRIDSATAPQLAEVLDKLIRSGRFHIILDLSEVEFMSSAGLRVLISAQKTCRRYNRGQVALAAVPKRIYEALELAGFVPLFRFYDNVLDAVGLV